MAEAKAEEAEYFSNDFDWELLKQQVETNPSFQFHMRPHLPSSSDKQLEEEEAEARDSNAWQSFHIRHSSGKFFKERRYLLKEFPELVVTSPDSTKVLEVGCGNGSSVIPILRGNKNITVYACDCSNETLVRVKEILDDNVPYAVDRFIPFFCDFASTGFPAWLACNSCKGIIHQNQQNCSSGSCYCLFGLDNAGQDAFLTHCFPDTRFKFVDRRPLLRWWSRFRYLGTANLIFTLSAVPLKLMPKAIKECFAVLKPGGLLLFRDYGLYDMTMLRFEPDKRVGFREYKRGDGTRSYFFCLDTVRDLFLDAGFVEVELDYCCVKSENRKKGKTMQRVWVHGKFQKPML
ncbi:tRNA N(3)-methylcytidine methyltransferase METTL6 [Linum grandiflorum]